jgi:hypothetical protein
MQRSARERAALVALAILLLTILALVSIAAVTYFSELRSPGSNHLFSLTPEPDSAAGPIVRAQITVVDITPWDGTVRMRVAGHYSCPSPCASGLRLLFASLPLQKSGSAEIPAVENVTFPAGESDVKQDITLPVSGEWIDYPLDSYRLLLGIAEERIRSDGTLEPVPAAEARSRIGLTLQEHVTAIDMDPPALADPANLTKTARDYPLAAAAQIRFVRAKYDFGATTALVLLAISASAYAVFFRPFHELAIGATGLALSLWGVRSLLLGNSPGITTVDLLLVSVIIFVLSGVAVRVFVGILERRAPE